MLQKVISKIQKTLDTNCQNKSDNDLLIFGAQKQFIVPILQFKFKRTWNTEMRG